MKKFTKLTSRLFLFSLFLSQWSVAQSVKRQSIGSYSFNGYNDGIILGQTIGQTFSSGNIPDGELQLRVIPYPEVLSGYIILVTATTDLQGVIMTAYVSTVVKLMWHSLIAQVPQEIYREI